MAGRRGSARLGAFDGRPEDRRMIRPHSTYGLALALVLAACSVPGNQDAESRAGAATTRPGLRFDTSAGSFTAVLYPEAAPETVALYLDFVAEGYFNGRSFDRVVPGFVIQLTDCAVSSVTSDSRTVPLEVTEEHFFSAGALGIARSTDPNSGGAQFFVNDFAAGHLNGEYTVWGQVIDGMDVVRKAARVQAVDFTAGGQAPAVLGDRCALEPVEINGIETVDLVLDAGLSARLPLRTAARVSTELAGYNLEWPATLARGRSTDFTAYIRMRDAAAAPPSELTIGIGMAELTATVDGATPGIYRFDWTPPAAGDYDVLLRSGGSELATLLLTVPE